MTNRSRNAASRRGFIKTLGKGVVSSSLFVSGFPAIVPESVFGRTAPSNRINIGAIGNSRISRIHDLPGVWKYDNAQIMAVCDLDTPSWVFPVFLA